MTKRIETPAPEETITIPKSSFDNIFTIMEEMRQEIADLRSIISERPVQEDYLLSVNEAAEYCGVARQTISKWTREKMLRKVYKRGRCGYLKSELDTIREA